MDIKPENILLSIDKTREGSIDSDGGYSDGEKIEEEITFKLGKIQAFIISRFILLV